MTDLRDVLLSLADPPAAAPEPVPELERRQRRRWRRRAAVRGGTVTACLLVLVAGIASVDRSTVSPAAGPDVAVTVAPPANAPTTAVSDPSECRNSSNASCGPFRWDPEPPEAPIDVRVTVEPAAPRVGEAVTFTVEVRRAAGYARQVAAATGDGGSPRPQDGWSCTRPGLSPRYGAWDLPPAEPWQGTATSTWTYQTAGTYTARFAFDTWTCNAQYMVEYPGRGEASVVVTVAP